MAATKADPAFAALLDRVGFDPPVRAVMAQATSVREALDLLAQNGHYTDALRLAARSMPRPYVVAWACECVRTELAAGRELSFEDKAGLSIAERWLREQTEANRHAAADFAQKAAYSSMAALLAATVGW